jgi:hypothetical protein
VFGLYLVGFVDNCFGSGIGLGFDIVDFGTVDIVDFGIVVDGADFDTVVACFGIVVDFDNRFGTGIELDFGTAVVGVGIDCCCHSR